MKKALLVIDMQNDYLWKDRQKKFTYNTDELVNNVNKAIDEYKDECDIIYISHLIQNFATNRLLFGFSIQGTKGAELYDKLSIISDLKFDKYFGDAFTSKMFKEHMKNGNYEEVILCGLDQCGCVYHTAIGAIKTKYKVSIIEKATGCRYSKEKCDKYKNKLTSQGVKFI